MKSPYTGKEMKLVREEGVKLSFRKEDFEINYHCFLCKDSGEKFTTEELDRINLTQVYNKYREKYGIPFPEEIQIIRENYEISANKMSEILGLGTNSYRLYENGEMPSVANGRLILAIKDPEDFIKQVQACTHILSEKERKKIIDRANNLLEKRRKNNWDTLFAQHIFQFEQANEYSGYKNPDLNKISNVIEYLSQRIEVLYKTKLNKLLFYCDFIMFQKTGFSITGITYRAIQFGPVPAEYDKLYSKLKDDDRIDILQLENNDGNYYEVIKAIHICNEEYFKEEEIKILNLVVTQFGKMKSSELVQKSHEELAWIENKDKKALISYAKYAFALNSI